MINYEMALYEIEMYKKAHESLSENLTLANKKAQQYKAERDKFEKMLNKECECGYKLEGQLHDMTKQRDTLIDDLSWYKAKVSRLEKENEKLKATNENLNNRVRNLNLDGQIQHDELMSCDGEVRYWKDKYTTLTEHIRLKAENNPSVDRYIELKNFITRLEKGE